MSKVVIEESLKQKLPSAYVFRQSLISGIGWAFGVTIGFVLISTIFVVALRALGGLPFVGGILASLIESTLEQLYTRTPVFR